MPSFSSFTAGSTHYPMNAKTHQSPALTIAVFFFLTTFFGRSSTAAATASAASSVASSAPDTVRHAPGEVTLGEG